ncbi:MAG: hypothetical protein NTX71_08315 [Candidatus Aureabacteria bacterium]|nr:hypothetical protein [Candidatus Auribacterota bacterium]
MNRGRIESSGCDLGDNLNFEIDFYRAIIEKAPDYVEALSVLGEAYARKGLYQEGLKIDQRLTALRPKDPIAHYNLACSYSLIHKKSEALASLRRSITLGYRDIAHIATDGDLAWLHDDQLFHRLIRYICKKIIKKNWAPNLR